MARILILYGTTEGQTKKIADVIGARVTSQGMAADVIEAGTGDPQPEHYDGIIVAASLHGGRLVLGGPDSPHRLLPRLRVPTYFALERDDETCPAAHLARARCQRHCFGP